MGREQREKAGPKESAPTEQKTTEYRIVISTGMNTQDEIRTLNDMAKKGFEHYLTLPLYGSTEKLYFRKY